MPDQTTLTGAVLRSCSIPGCPATYDTADGPPHEERWLRKASPSVVLCPAHTWLFDHHVPRLDHTTRTCSCDCGLSLPGPTLGHMGTAWVAHALTLLTEPQVTP